MDTCVGVFTCMTNFIAIYSVLLLILSVRSWCFVCLFKLWFVCTVVMGKHKQEFEEQEFAFLTDV